jgi:hypothetical protein
MTRPIVATAWGYAARSSRFAPRSRSSERIWRICTAAWRAAARLPRRSAQPGWRRIALEGLTGSRMCVCPDVAPTRHGWSLIQSRRIFVVMVSGIAGLRRHFE